MVNSTFPDRASRAERRSPGAVADGREARVLFVGAHLKTGGVERQWSFLLPALRNEGFDVSLLTLTAEGDFFPSIREAGIRAACARMRNRTDLVGLRRALAHSKWRPDIVVTNSMLGHFVGHLLARRASARHVATEHGAGRLATDRRSNHPALRLIAPRVAGVVAVTEQQVPYLTALGYRRERIHVVGSGIPDIDATRHRADVRRDLALGPDEFAAMLIATLRPEKRADLFIRAVSRAHAHDPGIRGVIAGRGPLFAALREQAETAGGTVLLLGERSDVFDLMVAADAVCLTSESEALPMVLMEAMALQRSIIATDVGGTRDLIVSGETGVLIPPNDEDALVTALLEARAQPARQEEYGASARRRQQALFTLERMVQGYGRAFTELMASPRV